MPEVSVLMAAYNAEVTIARSVASVLTQSLSDLELIVVDDGSTDRTLQLLSDINDPRVKVIQQPNQGPSAARNSAAAHAKADYLACIDADDVWLPGKLALQHERLKRAPHAALTYGWAEITDAEGKALYRDQRPNYEGCVFERLLAGNFIVSGSNTLITRDAFNAVQGFDESLRAVEDWDLHARLAYHSPVVCTPHRVVQYRLRQASLSTNLDLMERSWWQASNKLFALDDRLADQQDRSASAFYLYLATRALQTRRGFERMSLCLTYLGKAVRLAPASLPKILMIASPMGAVKGWLRQ